MFNSNLYFNNTFYFIFCILISLILSVLLLLITWFFSIKNYDFEKINPYECGFQPFEDTRSKFDIKYYLVAILYIIFDLEIIFFLPWVITVSNLNINSILVMCIFFIFLIIGFIYERLKGALKWS